jgi:hypothetical protein
MWTALFWRGLGERAVKTFAQALIAVLGANGVGLLNADWGGALSAAGMAALLSVLTSFATPTTVAGSAGPPVNRPQ